jgi:hypothetical protein
MVRGCTRLTARSSVSATNEAARLRYEDRQSQKIWHTVLRQTLHRYHAIVTSNRQELSRRCRPSPGTVVAGEGAFRGGEAEFGRLPRSDWQAAAFSAFLPLCLEDSRAPPQPISAPIPPLCSSFSIELLLHTLLPYRQIVFQPALTYTPLELSSRLTPT